MENKILETIKLTKPSYVKIDLIDEGDGGIILNFDDDKITITGEHSQDCCERVFADFTIFKHYIKQLYGSYRNVIIKSVSEMGILLCFESDWGTDEKVFVPCYNEQNGYYSSNLDLCVNHNGVIKKIDITECNQDKVW